MNTSIAEETKVIFLNVTDQVFSFKDDSGTEWHWNASAGMRLIEQAPRPPCAFHPSEHGLTIEHLHKQYTGLDESYALTTDLRQPILFVPFPGGTSVLIDGWHRLAKTILIGAPFLLCYELTEKERDEILVMKIPPKPQLVSANPPRLAPMAPTRSREAPRPKGGHRQ